MTENEHVQKALDTLAELCDDTEGTDHNYSRRSAAEEILRHYREQAMTDPNRGVVVNLRVEGHVPVRPVMSPPK